MFKQKYVISAIFIATMLPIYPQVSRAESFTSDEFLTWNRQNQGFYFRTSIGMAGLIAGFNNKEQGHCIDRWYFNDTGNAEAKLLDAMRRFPSYHPRGVIVAVLQKACGKLRYRAD